MYMKKKFSLRLPYSKAYIYIQDSNNDNIKSFTCGFLVFFSILVLTFWYISLLGMK